MEPGGARNIESHEEKLSLLSEKIHNLMLLGYVYLKTHIIFFKFIMHQPLRFCYFLDPEFDYVEIVSI